MTAEKPVAVVVGGTGGIGAGACLALRDAGYTTVALSRNTGNFLCDVTNPASVESAFGGVWGLFGRMDVLVNAFGAPPCTTPTLELTDEQFERVWQTDVTGCLRTCRQFLRYGSSGKVIVNVGSYHSIATYPTRREGTEVPGDQAGGRQAVIERSLIQAIEWLRATLGPDASQWQWGKIHRAPFDHPLGMQKPLDRICSRGPVPIGGDTDTPCQTAVAPENPYDNRSWSPSFRQIVDLSDLTRSTITTVPGQSGRL